MQNPKILENKINIKFKNKKLLSQSLIHKSFDLLSNNEKLEFLGDRVLALVISKKIFNLYPYETEGNLDKKFASMVNRKTCLKISNILELEKYMKENNIAIEYYKQAEILLYKNSIPRMLALTLYRIAQIYKLENDLENLAEYLKKVNVKYLYEGYHSDYHQLSKLVTHKR